MKTGPEFAAGKYSQDVQRAARQPLTPTDGRNNTHSGAAIKVE